MVLLRTERLTLREFAESDWPALHTFEARPEVARFRPVEPRTAEDCRAYVARAIEGAAADPRHIYDLAVILTSEDRLIGRCGLRITDPELDEGMLWYTLHPDYWGRGYATEAARAMVDFGFRELRLHRTWAGCDPANVASWRVMERVGMRREGHLRENTRIKGIWTDSLIYAILDREWA
jgi:[ribosomal protein S5]-alanine N-acetyltransferase